MSLKISKNLELPIESVTQTFGILAKRGVGKTYTASVMAEEMLKNNLHVVIIDPIGVWYGLRSSADGKKEGLSIIIAGGEHADVPISPESGEVLANLIVDNRLSMVVDVSLFRKGQQVKFMTDFAETLYRRNRNALHLILDEADAFAPQRPMPGEQRLLGAIEDIVRRGRARGLGVTMITQRPSVLNKNVLTQIEVLVALRLTAPIDQKAVDEWVKTNAEEGQREEFLSAIGSLPVGTAYFWSPGWLEIFKKVQVRKRETLDSSSTPIAGKKVVKAEKMAKVDLKWLADSLDRAVEKVESNDPKVLKKRIADLEKQLKNQKPKIEIREAVVEVLPAALLEVIKKSTKDIEAEAQRIRMTAEATPPPLAKWPAELPPNRGFKADRIIVDELGGDFKLSLAERKILSVLAQYPQGRTMNQVALVSGYAINGGGFRNALSSLRTKGLIDGKGDLKITETGQIAIDGDYEPLPQGPELINYWQGKLGKAERTILGQLTNYYPEELSVEQIAEVSGYASNGGGFRNALSRLRTLELIEGRQNIKANDSLFVNVKGD